MGRLLVLLVILCVESVFTGILPYTKGELFTQLETHSDTIYIVIAYYFANFFIIDLAQSVKAFAVRQVALGKRVERTAELTQTKYSDISNKPQRIQEDVKLSYQNRITVWAEYFVSSCILIQLVIMNLSTPMLVVSAVVYSAVSILIAIKFSPRLMEAEVNSQQAEANYRTQLVKDIYNVTLLPEVNLTVLKAEKIRMYYSLFTRLQLGLLNVLPFIILVPMLYAGTITFGEVMQHASSFTLLVTNACILLNMYLVYVQGVASEKRVNELTKGE